MSISIPPRPRIICPAPGLWTGYPRPDWDGFNARLRSGYNPDYKQPGDPVGHKGEDLGADKGSPALACYAQSIHFVTDNLGDNPQAGWTVEGTTPAPGGAWGFRNLHLQEGSILVHVGDQVQAGQPIAKVGDSGTIANYPHIHFETRWLPGGARLGSLVSQGIPLDPITFGVLGNIPIAWPALLRPGDTDPCVPALHGILYTLGYRRTAGGKSTYTVADAAATRRFQAADGLIPDGLIGPHTRSHFAAALDRALN